MFSHSSKRQNISHLMNIMGRLLPIPKIKSNVQPHHFICVEQHKQIMTATSAQKKKCSASPLQLLVQIQTTLDTV